MYNLKRKKEQTRWQWILVTCNIMDIIDTNNDAVRYLEYIKCISKYQTTMKLVVQNKCKNLSLKQR